MTDTEIVKALECCCSQDGSVPCWDCPCWVEETDDCVGIDWGAVINLINRQKAEIERLKADNENYIKVAETQQSLTMHKGFEIKRLNDVLEKRTTELDRLTIYFDKAVEEKLKTAYGYSRME